MKEWTREKEALQVESNCLPYWEEYRQCIFKAKERTQLIECEKMRRIYKYCTYENEQKAKNNKQ